MVINLVVLIGLWGWNKLLGRIRSMSNDDWKNDTDWQKTTFGQSTYKVVEMDHGLWVNDRFVSNEQIDEIFLLKSKGLNLREISKEVGVSVERLKTVWSYKK
jgi:hypothetical protein|tara:strand:- start:128 stop:433 length:306 start_codon:yes stop_codon:yes gene_type:complete